MRGNRWGDAVLTLALVCVTASLGMAEGQALDACIKCNGEENAEVTAYVVHLSLFPGL